MGTNYYVAKNMCECCNRYDEEYHIGKSSMGWAFCFRGYPAEQLTSWRAWRLFLRDQIIIDEYGERKDYTWFVNMVETYKSPGWIDERGRKNLVHNEEGKKAKIPYFNADRDWDDEDGYSFTTTEFS